MKSREYHLTDMMRGKTIKQLCGAVLPLFAAVILTSCDWNAKVDTASWQYYSFEEAGIAMLLPEEMKDGDALNVVYHGSSEELQLTITAVGELFADTEKLAVNVSKATGQEAEIVSAQGIELVRPASSEQVRTAEYYFVNYDGDTYHVLLSAVEECKEKRAKALLSAVSESICCSSDTPAGTTVRAHTETGVERMAADYLVLVNKRRSIPEKWVDLITLVKTTNGRGETIPIEKTACKAFFGLQKALAEENVQVDLASAYDDDGEHRTGLALDLYLRVDGKDIRETGESAQYPETWAKTHARLADYGFILRYPENGEYYTGNAYKPWHIRYVGIKAAREIVAQGITLEEYLSDAA